MYRNWSPKSTDGVRWNLTFCTTKELVEQTQPTEWEEKYKIFTSCASEEVNPKISLKFLVEHAIHSLEQGLRVFFQVDSAMRPALWGPWSRIWNLFEANHKQGWGNGSVGKGLAASAGGPEFRSPIQWHQPWSFPAQRLVHLLKGEGIEGMEQKDKQRILLRIVWKIYSQIARIFPSILFG